MGMVLGASCFGTGSNQSKTNSRYCSRAHMDIFSIRLHWE